MEKLSEPEKCFLCLKVRKQIGDFENCENHGNGKGSSNSSWNPFSAKVIGRYFKIPLLEESPNSIDSDRFSLCEKCGKVWNTLSELIQLNEIIEMKISYWLEVMEKVLVGANRMENKTENFGEEETNSHILPLRLRKTILSKCSAHRTKSFKFRQPKVKLTRLGKVEEDPVIVVKTETEESTAFIEVEETSAIFQIKLEPVSLSPKKYDYHYHDESPSDCDWTPSSPTPSMAASMEGDESSGEDEIEVPKTLLSNFAELEVIRTKPVKTVMELKPKPMKDRVSECKSYDKIKCATCGKWISEVHIREHRKRHRTGRKPYKCGWPGCEKTFACIKARKEHVQSIHENIRHECSHCGKQFSFRRSLTHHLLLNVCKKKTPAVDKVKKYNCLICYKDFATNKELNQHRYTVHTHKISCEYCGKIFSRSDYYKFHLQSRHGEGQDKEAKSEVKRNTFVCPVPGCGKIYVYNETNLRVHIARMHKEVQETSVL